VAAWQAPFWQTPLEQWFPQKPQLLASLVQLTSQPLAGLPSQSLKLGSQAAIWQVLLTHVAEALGRLQTWPQPPQLLTSLEVSTQALPQNV
jgi:hypothetical protein